jgi:hypothetical protein
MFKKNKLINIWIYEGISLMTHIRPTKKISKYDQINVKIDQ